MPSKKRLVIGSITFAVYVLTSQASRFLFYSLQTSPAVTLTPAGITLAAFLLYGPWLWPVIAIGALVSVYLNSTPIALGIVGASGVVMQPLVGYYILRKFKFDPTIARLRDIAGLLAVAIFTPAIGPLFMAAARWLMGSNGASVTPWNYIWLGGVLSTVVTTPILVRWLSHPQFKVKQTEARTRETIIAFLLLTGINFLIFWTPYTTLGGFSMAIFQLAIFTWIALRMGTGRMTLAIFTTTIIGLAGPYFGMVRLVGDEFSKKIVGIELYMIIFAIIFYIISAISEERDLAASALKKNIGDLEEALQKISSEDQKKNEFIAILAHELRNPLAPIVTHLEIMEAQGIRSSKFNDDVEEISRQITIMTRLIDDLLDVARITQGKIQLQKEKIDARLIIERAVESTRRTVKARQHGLSVQLPPSPVWIFADPVRIEQILVNLLNNASKYMEPGGNIRLTCDATDKHVVIKVRDAGMGIASEALATIFDTFHQTDTLITRTHGGLGVGLRLAKTLIELHDGAIFAESEGVGRGSEFTLWIPNYHERNQS